MVIARNTATIVAISEADRTAESGMYSRHDTQMPLQQGDEPAILGIAQRLAVSDTDETSFKFERCSTEEGGAGTL